MTAAETAFIYISYAKDRQRIAASLMAGPQNLIVATETWTVAEAPDNPNAIAIPAQTPLGVLGLEFPRTEARELARQLAALTSPSPGGKQ